MSRRRVLVVSALVGVMVAGWAAIAIDARATYGARTTADEPQYLLSALSLAEDGDLWIDDELADERYRSFHEVTLPPQTERLDNGREVSPHDPLLPAALAVPMGLGGWAAAKATLAVLGGGLAALLTWTAHRRLAVPLGVAAVTVVAFGVAAPLSAYATQVYPELPAALVVTVAIAALTGPLRRAGMVALTLAVVALPWLSVKYVPVAGVLAAIGLVRLWRSVPDSARPGRPDAADRITVAASDSPADAGPALGGRVEGAAVAVAGADAVPDGGRGRRLSAVAVLAVLGLAGVAYLVVHRTLYGGWTVYAAGDHFVGGEVTVVGNDPDYLGRSRRLAGLLLDRGFGLAAWAPGYLLAVPALAALVRRRPPGWLVLVAPLAAGWATATWVALTMHGWWWPGRQVVVVLPAVVLTVAWWAGRVRAVRPAVVVAGVVGAASWLWLVAEVLARRLTLVVDFEATRNPLYRAWRLLLPDYRHPDAGDWLLQAAWLAALGVAALAAAGLRPSDLRRPWPRTTADQHGAGPRLRLGIPTPRSKPGVPSAQVAPAAEPRELGATPSSRQDPPPPRPVSGEPTVAGSSSSDDPGDVDRPGPPPRHPVPVGPPVQPDKPPTGPTEGDRSHVRP